VVAVLLWKVLLAFILPFIGIAVGFAFLIAKIVFWSVMICVAIWVFRRLTRRDEAPA
jgi:hypothetical protein